MFYIVSKKKSWNWGDIEMKQDKNENTIISYAAFLSFPFTFSSFFFFLVLH